MVEGVGLLEQVAGPVVFVGGDSQIRVCYLAKPADSVVFEAGRAIEFVGFRDSATGLVIFDEARRPGRLGPDLRETGEDAAIHRVIFIFGHARRGFGVERVGDADEIARIVIAVLGDEAAVNNRAAIVIDGHVGRCGAVEADGRTGPLARSAIIPAVDDFSVGECHQTRLTVEGDHVVVVPRHEAGAERLGERRVTNRVSVE